MKIAFFSDCYLDLTGGIVTAINSEKQELERRGHTVYVFSSAYPRSAAERHKLAKSHIYPVPSCRLLGRGLTPVARRPRVVEKWLLRHHPELRDFDIFYAHYEAGCSIAGLRLGRRLGIPTVQVMHGREDRGEELIVPRGFRTIVATLLNWAHSWYLPHPVKVPRDTYLAPTLARARMWELMVNHANAADLVITPSAFFGRMLAHYGVTRPIKPLHHALPSKYLAIPVTGKTIGAYFGADRGRGRNTGAPFTPDRPLEITWHARLSPEKRILPFLEALTLVQTPYRLSAYGDGLQVRQAQRYAARHHLNVTFHGPSTFDQIWRGLAKSHLDVLVSVDYDTFGMTLIESAAAGVPVLIADPNLAEIVPTGSYLLAASPAPVDLARAIDDLAAHPDRLEQMHEKMLAHRDELSITHKIDQLEHIFNGIIKL